MVRLKLELNKRCHYYLRLMEGLLLILESYLSPSDAELDDDFAKLCEDMRESREARERQEEGDPDQEQRSRTSSARTTTNSRGRSSVASSNEVKETHSRSSSLSFLLSNMKWLE